jgi:tRNA1Val (adenine37-N6)-methyltransferase
MGNRRKEAFDFQRFRVNHDRCAMKVGTDAVLLGAWVSVAGVTRALDVGTGSGVIALILAQRTDANAHIDGVEMREADALQAQENVVASPWPACVKIHHQRIQDFTSHAPYDLLVCNPPFFSNSQLPPSAARQQVRHTQTLTATDLLSAAARLLQPFGRLAVVLPTREGDAWNMQALAAGWHAVRRLAFFSRPGKPQERWLIEWARQPVAMQTDALYLYDGATLEWSKDYRALTQDLYLPG